MNRDGTVSETYASINDRYSADYGKTTGTMTIGYGVAGDELFYRGGVNTHSYLHDYHGLYRNEEMDAARRAYAMGYRGHEADAAAGRFLAGVVMTPFLGLEEATTEAVGALEGVGVGAFAGESIAARSAARDFTAAERTDIDQIGSETECHTCGTTAPGTKSDHFVPDH